MINMRVESFLRAKDDIETLFTESSLFSYTRNDLREIFTNHRSEWKIAAYRNYKHFISFLEENNILTKERLAHLSSGSIKQIWNKPEAVHFHKGLTIKKAGYLSTYSAMQVHQITLQIPKTIFVSFDQYGVVNNNSIALSQTAVDKAFSKPQRMTSDIYKSEGDGYRYAFLQRKFNSLDVGVKKINNMRVTDLERTLIDIAVRPAYSGGVFEVLESFKNAIKLVNVEVLYQYLNQLDYTYPYHQVIGFYLEKAGYENQRLTLFLDKKTDINFYLTYNMSKVTLNQKWGVYFPMGF